MHVILTLKEYQLVYKNSGQYNGFVIQQLTKPKESDSQFSGEGRWVDRWYPNSLEHGLKLLLELAIGTEGQVPMSELKDHWTALAEQVMAAGRAMDKEWKAKKK